MSDQSADSFIEAPPIPYRKHYKADVRHQSASTLIVTTDQKPSKKMKVRSQIAHQEPREQVSKSDHELQLSIQEKVLDETANLQTTQIDAENQDRDRFLKQNQETVTLPPRAPNPNRSVSTRQSKNSSSVNPAPRSSKDASQLKRHAIDTSNS